MPKWLRLNLHQGVLLLAHDVLALYLSIGIANQIRAGHWIPVIDFSLVAVIATTVVALYGMNVYSLDKQISNTQLAARTLIAVALSGGIIAAVLYVTKATETSELFYRGTLPLSLAIFAIWTTAVRYLIIRLVRRFVRERMWLVIGEGPRSQILKDSQAHMVDGVSLEFLSGKESDLEKIELHYYDGIMKVKNPPGILYSEPISGLVLANDWPLPDSFVSQMMTVRLKGVPILDLADFYEQFLLRVPVTQLKDQWFALSQGFSLLHRDIEWKIKRLLDMVISAIGLIVLFPLIVLIGILVKITSQGPVFYSQTRCGHHGIPFRLHKFRTMVVDAERNGAQWAQPDDPRVTPMGRFLRRARFDELPQMWNVLIGKMSFIGPRPERPDFIEDLEREIPYYKLRHLVKPGITGWAQIFYPYGASVEDAKNKLEFDLYYIKNYSLALDLYILLATIRVMLSRSGT